MFSTTNTIPTHIVPITATITFMMRLAHDSEMGFLATGRIKSSNITPVIEFRPVDIELQI
jgi:hypothetical protein